MKKDYTGFYALFILLAINCRVNSQSLPIKPARTIAFTTNEGSYMDLDVSPDGKTIIFDLLGDLYIVPATGGKATRLTRGIALNTKPVFSPDGKKIAYFSDRTGDFALTVRELEGTLVRTFKSTNSIAYRPLWTSDGKSVIISNTAYRLDGGTHVIDKGVIVGFSADGKSYYKQSYSPAEVDRVEEGTGDRSFVYGLPKDPHNLIRNLQLSPDGHWLSYLKDSAIDKSSWPKTNRSLTCVNLVSHTSRILVSSLTISVVGGNMPPSSYAFSPDNKAIYIGYAGKIHRIRLTDGKDEIVPFTADVKSDLGPLDYNTFRVSHEPMKVKYTRSAMASPDGKKLVFTALNCVYVQDLPNGKPRILIHQSCSQYQPCWSPDGKWIAYVSWSDTTGGYLWKVSATGGRPEKLTLTAGEYQRPAWSPDGKYVAVVKGGPEQSPDGKSYAHGQGEPQLGERDDSGIGQLQLVSVVGGTIKALTDSIPLWNELTFSPDGKYLNYERNSKKDKDGQLLVSQEIQTAGFKILAVNKDADLDPWLQQATISPDRRFIVYSLGESLYLVPLLTKDSAATLYDKQKGARGIRIANGLDPNWEQGGKILSWSYGNRFYRIDPVRVVRLAAKKDTVSIQPDQTVNLALTVPQNYAFGTMALTNARIITMQGNKVIEKGTIVIHNGRFTAIGKNGTVAIPNAARIIDLKGKTIIPGFVDLHLHMRVPPDVFPQQSWMYLVNLAFGVTTAREPASSYDCFGYAELINSGQMIGPRIYTTGKAISEGRYEMDGLKDAEIAVGQRKLLGGTFMKQYMTGARRIQREWLLMASRKAGLNMTNEAGTLGWVSMLAMIKDGSSGVEHNPAWGDAYKDITTFFASSGTYFTPTLQVEPPPGAKAYFDHVYWHGNNEKLRRFMPQESAMGETINGHESYNWITKGEPEDTTTYWFLNAAQVDARIRHAGGLVTLGSHGNDEGVGVHNEIWALQMGGMTNMEALQSATIMAAGGLGMQKDLGSIEAGKIADLVILNSNPLDDIHNTRDIKYVMKDGILYNGDTLDEIWPLKKKCPEWQLKTK